MASIKPNEFLTPQYIQFAYLPGVLVIAGTAYAQPALLPIAVTLAAALFGVQFYRQRQ